LFIRLKNQIDYSVFSTSRKVYVGRDGWLFDRGDAGWGLERLDTSGFEALQASFLGLARELHEKDIRLVVIGYPDKSRIYPEMTPSTESLIPPGGNYDRLRQFLARQQTLTFIDAEEILLREKSTTGDPVYYKTDAHADEIGQLGVVKEIVNQIARAENRSDIRRDEKFERAVGRVGWGNEARFLSPLVPVHEYTPYFKGTYAIGGDEPDGRWNLPGSYIAERADNGTGRAYDFEFRSRPELCSERLPGTVIFGNSFSDPYWSLGLHRYFCFIRRARTPTSRLKLFLETMPAGTKYFIFQYYAPSLLSDAPTMN
jgi:hypothetical protein